MIKSGSNIHSGAYFGVLVLLVISIPLSKFMMSISEFMLLFLWLWSGFSFRISSRFFKYRGIFKGSLHFLKYFFELAYSNIIEKFGLFFKNKAAVIFSLIYLIHIIGTLYSSDSNYVLKDLRIKLPLILFPVVFAGMEKINYKKFRVLMLFYVAAILAGTLISFWLFLQKNFIDIREISPFISSIRFSLNLSFGFFILLYFIIADKKFSVPVKLIFTLVAIWFFVFIILLESVTGFTIILFISLGFMLWHIFRSRRILFKVLMLLIVILIPAGIVFKVIHIVDKATMKPEINFENLAKYTSRGNIYTHDTINHGVEDGRLVGLYLCDNEMRIAWNERSDINFDYDEDLNYSIKEGLIRYLTSMDLPKDYDGIYSLSDWDIQMIENDCANVNYVKNPGFKTRILKIIKGYEVYNLTGNPSGSSVMQRIEYLKGSLAVIKENWLTGVGTGDLESSLYDKYDEMGTQLKDEYRYHAHNQYFAILISFGIFGFLIFIYALIYSPILTNSFSDYFFIVFFLIMTISMFSDDTLETQAGVTLFAFFYTFLMFGKTNSNAYFSK